MIYDMKVIYIYIYMLHETLYSVASASASYVLASASRIIFGHSLDLTLSGLGLDLDSSFSGVINKPDND